MTTQIRPDELIRILKAEFGYSGGGGAVFHTILSGVHTDSAAAAVVRGDLMTGQAGPVWARLAIGGIAGSIVTRDANDVIWSTYALSGTAGQTYTFPAASASIPGGSGVANQVTYWSAADTLAGDAGMVYDAANDLLTISGASATRAILQSNDAATNTATFPLRLDHITSGAATTNFGVGAEAYIEADDGNDYLAGSIAWRHSVAAVATRRARIEFRANYIGTSALCGVIEAPNTASADGNSRGLGSIDFQNTRNNVAQVAAGTSCVISGGAYNSIASGTQYCTISGGSQNSILSGNWNVISGGRLGSIDGSYSVVCGGYTGIISENYSAIIGGNTNTVTGRYSSIIAGNQNSVAGGASSVIAGTSCVSTGSYTMSGGRQAVDGGFNGVFLWADNHAANFSPTANDQFAARINGGAWFVAADLAAAPGIFNMLTLEGRITGAGAGAANDGTGILFKFESATDGQYRNQAKIGAAWSDPLDASRTSYLSFQLVNNAAALTEYMRLTPTALGLLIAPYAFNIAAVAASSNFYIEGTDSANVFNFVIRRQSNTAGRSPYFSFMRTRAGETTVQNGDIVGRAIWLAHDGTDYNTCADIRATINGAVAANTVPTDLSFWTTTTNVLVERVCITSGGNTQLGTPTTNYSQFDVDGDLTFTGTARIDWAKITANSVTLSAGTTPASVVADLQTANDGNVYHIDEAAATPGITLIVDFINVTAFNWVKILATYDGSATHSLEIELYNWNTASWDHFGAMNTGYEYVVGGVATVFENHDFFVPSDTNYIGTGGSAGQVRVQFNHPMGGNSSHDLDIDEVSLQH